MNMSTSDNHNHRKYDMIIVRRYSLENRDLSERLRLVYAPWIDITYNGFNDNSLNISEANDGQSGSTDTSINHKTA
jgi:hypothetical protein